MVKTAVQTLREARALIEAPERWTRGELARDKNGDFCAPRSANAVCWCSEGAMKKVGRTVAAWRLLESAVPNRNITRFNDGTYKNKPLGKQPRPAPVRHRKVLAAFDKAIELAEADESDER